MVFNNCHLLMTLMTDLHLFFFEMSKKCWARFRVRNSTYLPSSTKLLKLIHFLLLHIRYLLSGLF
jgi:hypothetical protein